MVPLLQHPERAVFNLHAPPYGTQLDEAPLLDENLVVQASLGQVRMVAVGSTAVRDAEQTYQPMLGLHGHIHESSGIRRIGRTVVINPGSDYSTGALERRADHARRREGQGAATGSRIAQRDAHAPTSMPLSPSTSARRALAQPRSTLRADACSRCAARIPRGCRTTGGRSRTRRAGATRRSRCSASSSRTSDRITPSMPSASPGSARPSSRSICAGHRCGPGIIYRDNRAVPEADAFRERFGAEYLHHLTGHVPAAFHVAAKILWIRAHEPEVFKATRLFLEPTEFLALALTGETVDRLDDGRRKRAARPPQTRMGARADRRARP